MAKGLRASVKKSNRTKLRARVFRPVEDARLERLHAKMLEVIEQPKPEPPKTKEMEADAEGAGASKEDSYPKDTAMDVDETGGFTAPDPTSKTQLKKRDDREKAKNKANRRRKPRNTIAFPKSKGKGALMPFSDTRIRKQRR